MPPNKALTVAAFGAKGSGKTAWVKQYIEASAPSRLLIWDFKHDKPLDGMGKPFTDLPALITAAKGPAWRLRYLVDHDRDIDWQFDLFCRCAWEAGNLTMFVDELPEVTRANKAPPAWRKCVNVGRLYRGRDGRDMSITVIAAGQRPEECDKSFTTNADIIHTGRLRSTAGAKDLAGLIGCDFRVLMALPDLHWVEKHAESMNFSQGVLSFVNKKAAPKKRLDRAPKAANLVNL